MDTPSVTRDETQVARPLGVLVRLIREDLKQGDEAAKLAGMPHYGAAGKKMMEARDSGNMTIKQLPEWSKRNFGLGRSQTLLYVSYAIATSKLSAPAYTSLDDFRRRHLGEERVPGSRRDAAWQRSIGKVHVDTLNHHRAEIKRAAEEREAERKLAIQLIDIGYKALASKLHPDRGGSRDAMSRLNQLRDRLKQYA